MHEGTIDLKRVAANVRKLRANHKWTQHELARKADIGTRTVEAIECAHYRSYDRSYVRLADALGVSLTQLLEQGDQA